MLCQARRDPSAGRASGRGGGSDLVYARALVDVDLSILGAPASRFDEYELQVREEYSWVPGFLFRTERRKILRDFLARPAIFNTAPFRERYEAQARANIERSLEALGG